MARAPPALSGPRPNQVARAKFRLAQINVLADGAQRRSRRHDGRRHRRRDRRGRFGRNCENLRSGGIVRPNLEPGGHVQNAPSHPDGGSDASVGARKPEAAQNALAGRLTALLQQPLPGTAEEPFAKSKNTKMSRISQRIFLPLTTLASLRSPCGARRLCPCDWHRLHGPPKHRAHALAPGRNHVADTRLPRRGALRVCGPAVCPRRCCRTPAAPGS